jgi:hypothetical protein
MEPTERGRALEGAGLARVVPQQDHLGVAEEPVDEHVRES